MKNRFSRIASAFGLMFSITTSALSPAILSTSALAQEKKQDNQQAVKVDKDKKSSDKSDKKEKATAKADSSDDSKEPLFDPKKPLGTNEDPSMIGKRNINKGFDKWVGGSQDKEVAMGRQYAAEIEKQLKLVDDPLITEYVNRVGQNIVNHSDAKVPFTIKVVDSDEVNAFALPGGFFYVNRGLILAAENESELAGVMAHEIGHVAARHAVEQQGKQQMIGWGLLGAMILTGGIGGTILQNTSGLIQGLIGLKYSRGAEWEADKLGLQYMYAAGYDPNGMATMFEKLSAMNKKKPNTLSKLFMTHPQSFERRDASLALASRFPEKEEYVISTSEFQRVKGHLMRLTNAKATTAGGIEDSAEPGRPTLKRRQPAPDDSTTPTDSTNDKKEIENERPQLKRRGEPTPSPSPSPNN